MTNTTTTAAPHAPVERDGRIVTIDILRGLAILWVICFHLWADMTFKLGTGGSLYIAVRHRLEEGRPLAALTAFGEVILGTGFHGVALFMILSGVSLTMNAYRRPEPGIVAGFVPRFRKLVVPYWSSILLIVCTVTIIALAQMALDSGSFSSQWDNVRNAAVAPLRIRADDVFWALTVFGWLFREKDVTIPVGSAWFVPLLLQYYLLFPLALRMLNRTGPLPLLLAGIAVTLISRAILIDLHARGVVETGDAARVMTALAPFRVAEFTTGMAIGWLLVHRRSEIGEWVRSPLDIGGLIVIAFLLQMAGAVLGPKAQVLTVLSDPTIQLAMAVYALPLLFKVPGRLETSVLASVLVFIGVISFPVLIVNDNMRLVASFLRYENFPEPLWWIFLVVVYVPIGVLIAHPLARLWGLLPQQRKRPSRAEEPAAAPLQTQPAAGG